METGRHRAQMNLLVDSLEDAWADRDDFFVAGNMGLYFSETQALRNDFRAPDVFVVLGTERRERKRWVVWEEGGRIPDVVIELTSPSTEQVDRGEKIRTYAELLRVSTYVIYDPFSGRLDGFQLDSAARRFVPLGKDARGFVEVAPLGLWLGVVQGVRRTIDAPWLRWFDARGEVLPDAHERLARHER